MHKLAELCVRRPVFATMLVLSLTVIGGFSFIGLGVDLIPNVDVPTVAITVVNPGASPEQIETEITKNIEGAVNTISGIDQLRSSSVEGQSMVILQFVLEKNGDVAAQEVRDKVNLVIPNLPETALAPVVQKFDPGAMPVLQIVVSSELPLREVTEIADEQIKQRLESINGVGQVQIVGGARRQIQVRLDPERMSAYGVTLSDVSSTLRQQNVELPGGRIERGSQELTVRTMGRITDAREFKDIAVANRNSYVVRIADIATVLDGQEELRTAAFLNGKSAVTVVVSKQSGLNTVTVAEEVKRRLATITPTLPPGVHAAVVMDQSTFIEAAVRSLQHHLLLGSLLASIVIFFFLANLRTTIISAIAIPVSIISTFFLMKVMGYTLNQLTMLALTLMVGVVIDDAIIVLENIYRFVEEKGMSPFEAAIAGTKEIGLAVMATTLSLMAVFVPVGFMGGIVGRFMSSFGLTAAFAIGVSLIVSFTLTPMLCSRFIKIPAGRGEHHTSKESRLFRPIERAYTAMLRWSMAHRAIVVVICLLVIASIVPLFMSIGKNFVPEDDRSEFQVTVRTPAGTGLPATLTVLERVAADLRAFPEVTDTLSTIGGSSAGLNPMGMISAGGVNSGSILVKLVAKDARRTSQQDVMVRARELLTHYPGNLNTSVQASGGPGGGGSAGVQYSVAGPDLVQLAKSSDAMLAQIRKLPDAVDADTSLVIGRPELRVEINRARAADLGVRVQDIAQALNILVGGDNVTTFNVGNNQYDVTLRAAERFRSRDGLERLTVSSSKRGAVPIAEVVTLVPGTGPSAIERLNRQRQVTLTAQVAPGASQASLMAEIDRVVAAANLPAGYTAAPAGQSVELARTATYFIIAISLSFIFMYIVLAAQFESFIHPITILLTLPLAVPFGILSLLVAGQTINIFAGLGLLLLFGIVKKNAILQIDHTIGLRASGLGKDEAIIRANQERLRPILMTTIALVAGMLPLIFSSDAGSATNRSIGVLVAGGQTLCLLLTLLAVPVFYSLFDDVQNLWVWSRAGSRRTRATVATMILLGVVSIGTAHAAPQERPVVDADQGLPQRVGITEERSITLSDAIAQALKNNPELAMSQVEVEVATNNIAMANGAFDPQFSLQSSFQRQQTPVSSLIGGAASGRLTQQGMLFEPDLRGVFRNTGTQYQLNYTSRRQTSDNQFVTLNPQFPMQFSVMVTQPLFRGLRIDEGRRQVERAKQNVTLSDTQLRQQAMELTLQTELAFWELSFAEQNLQVQRQGRDLARDQVASNQRLAGQGLAAPIDVLEAETQVATFNQRIYSAQAALTRAENALKMLIVPDRRAPLWASALHSATPPLADAVSPSLGSALAAARSNRPELAQAAIAANTQEGETRFLSDQRKPQIDLVGTYLSSGLAGRTIDGGSNPLSFGTQPLIDRINALSGLQGLPPLGSITQGGSTAPPALTGGFGRSLSNLVGGDFPTVEIGVRIALPFNNRTADARYASSVAESRRLKLQTQRLEIAIEADVRNALQAVESARAARDAALQARTLAEEQYASEQRRFEAGTSTVFLVVQRQTAMITTRTQFARTEADLSRAVAQLNYATGEILSANQIRLP